MDAPQRSLDEVAGAQYGVVTRRQALETGLTRRHVAARVASGQFVVMHPGIYRLEGSPGGLEQAAMAATLATGPQGLASHRTAGLLWGFPGLTRTVEVTVPLGKGAKVPELTIHRTRLLPAQDRAETKHIPVTSGLRTIFDLAGLYPKPGLEPMFDYGLIHRLFTRTEAEARLELLASKRRHFPSIESLLAERPVSARPMGSEFEVQLFKALDAAGVERPIPQFKVVLPDGRVRFIDFAYPPPTLLGLEPQGFVWHADRGAWERDRTRDNELIALGWALLPVTWRLLQAHPDQVAETVRRALAARRGTAGR